MNGILVKMSAPLWKAFKENYSRFMFLGLSSWIGRFGEGICGQEKIWPQVKPATLMRRFNMIHGRARKREGGRR